MYVFVRMKSFGSRPEHRCVLIKFESTWRYRKSIEMDELIIFLEISIHTSFFHTSHSIQLNRSGHLCLHHSPLADGSVTLKSNLVWFIYMALTLPPSEPLFAFPPSVNAISPLASRGYLSLFKLTVASRVAGMLPQLKWPLGVQGTH